MKWKQNHIAVFKSLTQGAKYGLENSSLLFWGWNEWIIELKRLEGRSPWNNSQIWTFSTLAYFFSGAWEKLISKAVVVKTNGDSKLLQF